MLHLLLSTTLGFGPTPASKVIYVIRHGEKVDGDHEAGQLIKYNQCLSQKGWTRAYNLKSVFGRAPLAPFRTPDVIFSANYQEPLECRDSNGFYRTQQTISALADNAPGGLNLKVDNTTGFMPAMCGLKWNPAAKKPYYKQRQSQPEPYKDLSKDWAMTQPEDPSSECFPYDSFPDGYEKTAGDSGMCCNGAAAQKILAKLAEPGIDTILVAWESHNAYHLAQALGAPKDDVPLYNDTDTGRALGGDNYDSVYVFTYDASGTTLTGFDPIGYHQGFDYPIPGSQHERHYLGPKSQCGAIEDTKFPFDPYPLRNVISPTDKDGDGIPEYTMADRRAMGMKKSP